MVPTLSGNFKLEKKVKSRAQWCSGEVCKWWWWEMGELNLIL